MGTPALTPLRPARVRTPPERRATFIRFTEHLELEGIRPSIGSVGDALDNTLMEHHLDGDFLARHRVRLDGKHI